MAGNCELTTQKIDEKFKERKLGVTEESSNKLERSESNKRDGQTSLLHSLKVLFNECMKPFIDQKYCHNTNCIQSQIEQSKNS